MKNFFQYLLVAGAITVIFAVIYTAVQQTYRSGANDPQLQIVQDIESRLHSDKSVEKYFDDTIDIAQSFTPFNALFDANGKAIRSTGYLHNSLPVLPAGVFDFAKAHNEDVLTWQPESGVRMAMVIKYVKASPVNFVASGRSLLDVEVREHNLTAIIIIGWIICIGLLLLNAVIGFFKNKENM